MSLRQQAIRGVLWSAVQNWGSSLIGTAVILVLARLLGPEPFGLVAYATVFISLLNSPQRNSSAQALIQRPALDAEHQDSAFWLCVATGSLLALATACSASTLAHWLSRPALTPVLAVLSITLVIDALGTTHDALLRRQMRFKPLAQRTLAASIAGGVVGIAFALLGFGIWSLVAQRLVASAVATAALWMASDWRPGRKTTWRHIRELLGFGAPVLGSEALGVVAAQAGPFFVGAFLGDKLLGYFHLGYQLLNSMTQLFTNTVAGVALPTFSRLQHVPSQLRAAYLSATRATAMLAFPAFVGASAVSPDFVAAVLGESWLPSIAIMQLLLLVGIVRAVTYFNGPLIVACGKPGTAFQLTLLNTVVTLIVFAITIRWGLLVACAAYMVRGYLFAPLPIGIVCRKLGIGWAEFGRTLAPAAIATGGMVLAVGLARWWLSGPLTTPALLAVECAVGLTVYGAALSRLAPGHLRQVMEWFRLAMPDRVVVGDVDDGLAP